MKNCRYDKGTLNWEQGTGNFTFRYLCRFFFRLPTYVEFLD
ncbi:MAG: hypothetical protein ACK5QV_20990 [Dolichospermum sp.]